MGWFAFIILLIVASVFYKKLTKQIAQLRDDMTAVQTELRQHEDNFSQFKSPYPIDDSTTATSLSNTPATLQSVPPPLPNSTATDNSLSAQNSETVALANLATPISTIPTQTAELSTATPVMEPDERSLPIVTSLIHSIKNWFFGGNLVVRVGVLVFLVGIVLLLRLLSEYVEIPIALKLAVIGGLGLGLAGLGLKLVKNRFAYGITLQGAGLAIAYLSTFFAYSVYHVLSSVPSFIGLGVLSAVTIALAVRQNAFPLALLALSGGFFAPILTSNDTGSLTALFSYYLLLNVTIAVIAHYRTWKVLNLFGFMVTFGLAYYWGAIGNLSTIIESQRWSLVLLVASHLLLYLFVVIRYAQQIISYNIDNEAAIALSQSNPDTSQASKSTSSLYVFPIDIGLLFSVPILAFGLFAALLNDIEHALTLTSAILAVAYLGLGWIFVQRSQRYALITEGMLALGFGFFALTIALALDAEWITAGWSLQALALVWFGRRSLRAWTVIFGLTLQLVSVALFIFAIIMSSDYYSIFAITISAISVLATVFILRADNSPITLTQSFNQNATHMLTERDLQHYASALNISEHAAKQSIANLDSKSTAFKMVWHSPVLIKTLTLGAIIWSLYVLIINVDNWLASWQLATTMLIAVAALISVIVYWIIDRYRLWREIRQFSHGLLMVFYLALIIQLPQKFEFTYIWMTSHWILFALLLIGWLVMGQLWLKTWHSHKTLSTYDSTSWLGTGVLVLAATVHYGLPDSQGVMALLIPVALVLAGLGLGYRRINIDTDTDIKTDIEIKSRPLYWFDWRQALLDNAKVFVPITLCWVIFTNWFYDGVIWGLPYFPLINLYDITLCLILMYGLGVYYLNQQSHISQTATNTHEKNIKTFGNNPLLIILGLIGFWVLSSMLIRTLHAFIGTALWDEGAWNSEQVQTGLTILWTLLALVATIIASRYWQRTLWFMGIGLLGIVVLKLVLVDLSQTEAIWRVISFLGAGSLILLIGYLAPLPPAHVEKADSV